MRSVAKTVTLQSLTNHPPKPIVEVVLLTTLRSTDSSSAGSALSSTVVIIEVARATGVYDMVREDRSSYSVWRARVQLAKSQRLEELHLNFDEERLKACMGYEWGKYVNTKHVNSIDNKCWI